MAKPVIFTVRIFSWKAYILNARHAITETENKCKALALISLVHDNPQKYKTEITEKTPTLLFPLVFMQK